MIRFSLSNGVIVSLDSDDPDLSAIISYEGQPIMIESVRRELESSYGAFGHLITDATTPADLHAAMRKEPMTRFNPQLIEGDNLIPSYKQNIPPGAKT